MKPAKFDTQPSPHFLMESATVDYTHADIRKLASALSSDDPTATARHCFEWVRDHIEHSMDFHREEVTCAASDVLQQGTGPYAPRKVICSWPYGAPTKSLRDSVIND